MGKVVSMKGNSHAKGRAKKRPTFTVKVKTTAYATTPDRRLAQWIATSYLSEERSVTIYDNAGRKSVAHFIYGREQT